MDLYIHLQRGTRYRSWLRHCATSQKIAGSSPNEVVGFFRFTSSYQPHCGPGVYSASDKSTRNLSGGKRRPARKADNLTAICEPIV
jgi:hypothetical protein